MQERERYPARIRPGGDIYEWLQGLRERVERRHRVHSVRLLPPAGESLQTSLTPPPTTQPRPQTVSETHVKSYKARTDTDRQLTTDDSENMADTDIEEDVTEEEELVTEGPEDEEEVTDTGPKEDVMDDPTPEALDRMTKQELEQLSKIKAVMSLKNPWKPADTQNMTNRLGNLRFQLALETDGSKDIQDIVDNEGLMPSEIPDEDAVKGYRVKYAYAKFIQKAESWRKNIRIRVAIVAAEQKLKKRTATKAKTPSEKTAKPETVKQSKTSSRAGTPSKATAKQSTTSSKAGTPSKKTVKQDTSSKATVKAGTPSKTTAKKSTTPFKAPSKASTSSKTTVRQSALETLKDRLAVTKRHREDVESSHSHKRHHSTDVDQLDISPEEAMVRVTLPKWLLETHTRDGRRIYAVDFFLQGMTIIYTETDRKGWKKIMPGQKGMNLLDGALRKSYLINGDDLTKFSTQQNLWDVAFPENLRKANHHVRFFRHDDRGFLVAWRNETDDVEWGYRLPTSQPQGHFEVRRDTVVTLRQVDRFYDEDWINLNIVERETGVVKQEEYEDIPEDW